MHRRRDDNRRDDNRRGDRRDDNRRDDSRRDDNRRRKSRSRSPQERYGYRKRERDPFPKRNKRRYSSSSLSSTDSEYLQTASWVVGRSRTRSPHPWLKQLAGSTAPKKDQDSELVWDGFQWVTRSNMSTANINQVIEANRRARRLGLSNVPFEYNLNENDIKDYLNKKMNEFRLNDQGNQNPVLKVWIDEDQPNACIAEFSSQEEATKALRLDGIKMLGRPLKVAKQEEIEGNEALGQTLGINQSVLSKHDDISTSAKAAATAVAAIQDIQGTVRNDFVVQHEYVKPKCKVLKICDFLDPKQTKRLPESEFRDMEADMKAEFETYGTVNYCAMVRPHKSKMGAEAGCVLIEFATPESADTARIKMIGKKFDKKDIRILEVPDEVFNDLKV